MSVEKEAKINKHDSGIYVISMFVVYALWKAFNYYVTHSHGIVQQTWGKVIYDLGAGYAAITSVLLNAIGEETVRTGIGVIFVKTNTGVLIEDHCLAIPATIIFIGTVGFYKGKWQNKIWFIPMGVCLIVLINIIRLFFLSYIYKHYTRSFYDINHSVVYVIITYLLVFWLIVIWMRKFAYWHKG